MTAVLAATMLLVCSNIFMTFAWYAHLRNLSGRAWYIAAIVSWGIAFFEYVLQVPANRIGYKALELGGLTCTPKRASQQAARVRASLEAPDLLAQPSTAQLVFLGR